jgi:hypothetical protein
MYRDGLEVAKSWALAEPLIKKACDAKVEEACKDLEAAAKCRLDYEAAHKAWKVASEQLVGTVKARAEKIILDRAAVEARNAGTRAWDEKLKAWVARYVKFSWSRQEYREGYCVNLVGTTVPCDSAAAYRRETHADCARTVRVKNLGRTPLNCQLTYQTQDQTQFIRSGTEERFYSHTAGFLCPDDDSVPGENGYHGFVVCKLSEANRKEIGLTEPGYKGDVIDLSVDGSVATRSEATGSTLESDPEPPPVPRLPPEPDQNTYFCMTPATSTSTTPVASDSGVTFIAADVEWQKQPAPSAMARAMDWESAKSYCRGLTLAGGGWRLPSLDQLSRLCWAKPEIRDNQDYWASDEYGVASSNQAWVQYCGVNSVGRVPDRDRWTASNGGNRVRCVR